ncbi:zinc ribbon domain-containing protein [Aeribacillus sp. FSL K6-1305]
MVASKIRCPFERTFQCKCGFVADRDWDNALNIKKEGLRLLA